MHFLCLHGVGSNSRVFEQQTAALRYELGDNHTYDFVEGTVPWEPATEESNGETFAYGDMFQASSCLEVYQDLRRYLEQEGPYDGVIGFSFGSGLALSILVDHYRCAASDATPPFKLAVFFCNPRGPYDINALRQGHMEILEPEQVERAIEIPTVHIWGSSDTDLDGGALGERFCNSTNRSAYVHAKGHEIPTSAADTMAMANVMRRAVVLAKGL
ncbi:serine hydrolase FSH [Aspergillus karnatakaensis]|uniref:serine hydrolase FSH n=1 Tax=Aspergillus karnatakaensis TaxID=1810916 RepID=UPI003CCCD17A